METTELRSGTWTVLFSDIVGCTEQRSRLGDEKADALHDRVDFLQRRAVAASRGLVIKGLGDGIMVAFEAANDGFDAAVAIQQTLELEFPDSARNLASPLAVHIRVVDLSSQTDRVHRVARQHPTAT